MGGGRGRARLAGADGGFALLLAVNPPRETVTMYASAVFLGISVTYAFEAASAVAPRRVLPPCRASRLWHRLAPL